MTLCFFSISFYVSLEAATTPKNDPAINPPAAYPNAVPTPGTGTKNVPIIPPIVAPAPAAISGLEDTSLSRLNRSAMDVVVCNKNSSPEIFPIA